MFGTFTLQNLTNKSGWVKTNLFTICTSHLRWNSAIRHCFYRTDLWQKAVFHNFEIQITLIQYSTILKYKLHSFSIQDDWSTPGLLAKPLKSFPKSPIRPAGSRFCSSWAVVDCLRASSYEPVWPGWLGYRDKLCLGFIWEISVRFPRWEKGQRSWERVLAPNSGNRANIAKHKNFNFWAYL